MKRFTDSLELKGGFFFYKRIFAAVSFLLSQSVIYVVVQIESLIKLFVVLYSFFFNLTANSISGFLGA